MSTDLMDTESASVSLDAKPTTTEKQPIPQHEVVRGHNFTAS